MVTQQLFSLQKEFAGGGKIEIMEGYTKQSDHRDLFAIARYFAEKGDRVQITTNVHFRDEKYKKGWCSPKYANLDKPEIDVKESEIESFQMIK
jgi:hypothetical protein